MQQDQIEKAFANLIREELIRSHSVEIDGIGTFSLKYHKPEEKERDDGTIVLMPPVRTLEFKPEGGS